MYFELALDRGLIRECDGYRDENNPFSRLSMVKLRSWKQRAEFLSRF